MAGPAEANTGGFWRFNMGRWCATVIFVLLLAVLVPTILALSPLAWTLRAARAGLRTIKPGYAFR